MKLRAVILIALSHYVAGWSRDMPGGMKVGINGKTYGFTTDMCSGGIFFKKPVDLDFMCTHGYFLRRANGCRIHGNDVVSGSNYVCTDGKHIKKSVQAFISLTSPSTPLDHTIAFFDEADTLENFRRYTYSKGLENRYKEDSVADAVGVIVSNPHKTPLISIGNLCYQGKTSSGSAYIAKLPKELKDGESSGFFVRKCSAKSIFFPWSKTHHYHFTEGYSSQLEFKNEITATLPAATFLKDLFGSDPSHFEIWNGLAYCLQGNQVQGSDGKFEMNGLNPSISRLQPLCSQKVHSRKTRDVAPMEIIEGTALARIARANEKTARSTAKGRRADGKGIQGRAAAGAETPEAKKSKDSSESEETAEPPESALLGCVMSCNGQAMNKIPPMFAARQFSMG